ncbi:insulinase family protein [Candidatus Woesearchaeota archaeon]|nr:insulinase family protein [Candidatus Woesearchaeota archaeon]
MKWILKNGMTLIYEPKDTASVAIQVLVNVGSNHETAKQRGISHFIEHMVFEGTTTRLNARAITNEIEKVGGISNAYTTTTRTCYHAKVPRKHFHIALEIIADILQNPLLRDNDTQRQKHILFKEIDLVTDEPRFHQWVLFQQALFLKHPSRFPTYGTRNTVQRMTSKDLQHFFDTMYHPRNMIMAVVGRVKDVKKEVERLFSAQNKKRCVWPNVHEPAQQKVRIKSEKRKGVSSTYLVVGHRTVPRLHPDSVVLDVIEGIVGRGQSGWMFDEIRNKEGLAYEVGVEVASEQDYGFFATFASVDKKNKDKTKELILSQLKKLEKVPALEVEEAKTYVEGGFLLDFEDTQRLADELLFWEQVGDVRAFYQYLNNIRKVTVADVQRVAKKYFTKPHVIAVIEGSDRFNKNRSPLSSRGVYRNPVSTF